MQEFFIYTNLNERLKAGIVCDTAERMETMSERTVPLSEYRREGYRLFYDNTSVPGLLIAATIGSFFIVAGVALLLTFAAAVVAIFGLTVEWSGFSQAWGSAFSAYDGKSLVEFLPLPFYILGNLWPLDLFFSLLFCAAALPERKSFMLREEHERGKSAGNIATRNIPLFIFWGVFFVLTLFPMSPYFRETVPLMSINLPLSQTAPVLTVFNMLVFSRGIALVMAYFWNAVFFNGLSIYHFFFVRGKKKVDKKRIQQRFTIASDDELGF